MLRSAILAFSLAFVGAAAAQGERPATPRETQPPVLPAPQPGPIPEKVDPPLAVDPPGTGSLSDKLERSDGVIRPPQGISPDMNVPAPVPDPGTTPVIPPPGSPGGNRDLQPKQ